MPGVERRLDPLNDISTLVEMLARRAEADGDKVWLTLYERDKVVATLTFQSVFENALRWAGVLAKLGVGRGDRVMIVLPTEQAFYESFFGTLLAGGVPVPAYPPVRMSRLEEYHRSLANQLLHSRARVLVTNERVRPLLRPAADLAGSEGQKVALLTPQGLGDGGPAAPVAVGPEDLGMLQYTSGSTGKQKGVMLTHANLIANVRAFGKAVSLGPDEVGVSWLPLYHDMGLIGLMLGTYYWGMPLISTSPIDFLRRPIRWLRMISRHKGTVTAAPNFAYSLVARKTREEERAELDLSSWRIALCGAEPIHPNTVRQFSETFAPVGLRPEAFFPAYGLAEATLAVCFHEPGTVARVTHFDNELLDAEGRVAERPADEGGKAMVSVGQPIETVEMGIVSETGEFLGEDARGEVVVRGPSVMAGYFENPEATGAAIQDGWLRTGDLGFVHDGEYYICGRQKDLVIKAGRNYFAEDIENAARGVQGVKPGGLCVFSVDNDARGTEEVVLVAEVAEEREGLAEEITRTVSETTGCRPDKVILVAPSTVPKTSSGKIQRFQARKWYLDGTLTDRQGERQTTAWWVFFKATLKDFLARFLGR